MPDAACVPRALQARAWAAYKHGDRLARDADNVFIGVADGALFNGGSFKGGDSAALTHCSHCCTIFQGSSLGSRRGESIFPYFCPLPPRALLCEFGPALSHTCSISDNKNGIFADLRGTARAKNSEKKTVGA